MWFGEVCACYCLPLLPQLACNILATTYLQALFSGQVYWIGQIAVRESRPLPSFRTFNDMFVMIVNTWTIVTGPPLSTTPVGSSRATGAGTSATTTRAAEWAPPPARRGGRRRARRDSTTPCGDNGESKAWGDYSSLTVDPSVYSVPLVGAPKISC